jgi:hypothetical protein
VAGRLRIDPNINDLIDNQISHKWDVQFVPKIMLLFLRKGMALRAAAVILASCEHRMICNYLASRENCRNGIRPECRQDHNFAELRRMAGQRRFRLGWADFNAQAWRVEAEHCVSLCDVHIGHH